MSRAPPKSSRARAGRKLGTKNPDHDAKKRELAGKLLGAVVDSRGRPSLHELARVAEVSIPTINHYFGGRSGAIAAALRTVEASAASHHEQMATPGDAPLARSLQTMATELAAAWNLFGVGALFASGMAAGVDDPLAGPGYIEGVLEPTVRAIEARLAVHAQRGDMSVAADDGLGIRVAALAFISPVLVALLHQHQLSGDHCRPLDIAVFIERHVERFVRAYGRAS